MAAYIKNQGPKHLGSPSLKNFPEEWEQLAEIADVLENELEDLRSMRYDTCKPHPYIDRIRELRRTLSKLDSEMHTILMRANPDYSEYWF